jgi:tripartite-type tricarboxylate transporter receptor subunit TctC
MQMLKWMAGMLLLVAGVVPTAGAQTQAAAKAAAPAWPTRPVRLVVGFSPGSATDLSARLLAPKLAEMWGQPVVIENRSGAGSSIANTMVAKATPDGYTLLVISASFAINSVLRGNAGYDPLRDFTSVSQIGYSTGVILVTPSLGVKTLKELIAAANERPGKILYGSAGAGSGVHFSTERFRMAAGIKVTHVAFKGQPEMLIEMLAGRIHFGIPGLGPSLSMIKDGRLIPVAVVTPKRSPLLPEVPTVLEILPNFRRDASHAIMAPAGTPRPVVEKVSKDVARVLAMPDVRKQMEAIDFIPDPTTPQEFDKTLRGMLVTFEEVARAAGLK